MSEVVTTSIVSVLGVSISALSLYISLQKSSKEDLKVQKEEYTKLEHRLTTLETTQFSLSDRKCQEENNVKINALWGMIMKDYPDILQHPHTPIYDSLLKKAKTDILCMSIEEKNKLSTLLDKEYKEAIDNKKRDLAHAIAVYRVVFNYESKKGGNETVC